MKKSLVIIILILILAMGVQAQNNPSISSINPTQIYEITQTNLTIAIANQGNICDSINNMTFVLNGINLNGYVKQASWVSLISGNNINYFTSNSALACGESISNQVKFGVTAPLVNSDTNYVITLNTLDVNNGTNSTTISFRVLNDAITPIILNTSPANYSFIKKGDTTFSFDLSDLESGLNNTGVTIGYDDNTALTTSGNVISSLPLTCDSSNVCSGILNTNQFLDTEPFRQFIDYRIINVKDNAGNKIDQGNTFPYHFFIDKEAPVLNLLNPSDGLATNANNLNVNYSATDDSFITVSPFNPNLDCITNLDSINVNEKTNVKNVTTNNVNLDLSSLIDGYHNWQVSCSDLAGYNTNSETRSFLLDRNGPNIYLVNSVNNTIVPNKMINLNVYDEFSSVDKVWYSYKGLSIIFTSVPSLDASTLADGTYNFAVSANDSLGNVNTTAFTFIVDNIPPVVNGIAPLNNTVSNSSVTFTYTPTDNHASVLTCNIDVDGIMISNKTVNNGIQDSVSTSLSGGSHTYSITCYDSVGNSVKNSGYSIFVDNVPPVTDLFYPLNGSWFNTSSVSVSYNTSDDYGVKSCSLYVNGIFNSENQSQIIQNAANYFNENLLDGESKLSVACTDNYYNTAFTGNISVNVDTVNPVTSLLINNRNPEYQTDDIQIQWGVSDLNKNTSLIEIFYPNGTLLSSSTNELVNVSFNKLTLDTLGNYSVHIFGNDTVNNKVDFYDSFVVQDTLAPNILLISPSNGNTFSAGTSSFVLILNTDESSICKIGNSDIAYENMSSFDNTNSTSHNTTINGLSNGNSYTRYILCQDGLGNTMNSSYVLTFSVASPSNNGGGNGGSGGGGGGGGGSSNNNRQNNQSNNNQSNENSQGNQNNNRQNNQNNNGNSANTPASENKKNNAPITGTAVTNIQSRPLSKFDKIMLIILGLSAIGIFVASRIIISRRKKPWERDFS